MEAVDDLIRLKLLMIRMLKYTFPEPKAVRVEYSVES